MRVPYADFSSFVVPEDAELTDDQVLFLSNIIPTAYWSVENSGVKEGDTVIVLGSGPVGLLTQKFAWMKGAEQVIAVDMLDYRLDHAKRTNSVETYNFEKVDGIGDLLKEETKGGADVVIDAVGMDGKKSTIEKVETTLMLQGGTLSAIETASKAVRKFGHVQLTGVYGLVYNGFPLGQFFSRNITLTMGQAPVIHYMPELFNMIKEEKFDPTDIITHRIPLEEAQKGYQLFHDREDSCIKVVLKP